MQDNEGLQKLRNHFQDWKKEIEKTQGESSAHPVWDLKCFWNGKLLISVKFLRRQNRLSLLLFSFLSFVSSPSLRSLPSSGETIKAYFNFVLPKQKKRQPAQGIFGY